MPIKVRCGKCERVIAAPDAARGKAVRCPDCKSPVRVPTKTKKESVAPTASDSSSDGGFFSSLDLSQAEDARARICPKCATQVPSGVSDCPTCFTNLVTGVVNTRAAKRMSRKGPNPALFYGAAWKDSFQFMLANQRLALQTWLVLCLISTLHLGMVWGSYYIITNHPVENAEGGGSDDPEEAKAIRSLPEIMASQQGFWFHRGLMFVLYMILVGWIWQMTVEVIRATQAKKSLVRRLNFGFLDAGAFGVKSLVWLVVFLLPVLCVAAPILVITGAIAVGTGGGGTGTMVVGLAVLIPIACVFLVTMPVAMVHMAQGHTYKAYSLPLMVFAACKNIPNVLYLCLVALVASLIPLGVLGGGIGAQFAVNNRAVGPPHELLYSLQDLFPVRNGGEVTPALMEKLVFPWKGAGIWMGAIVVAGPFISYAIVFVIRALGLMGFYFQRRLDLINRTKPNQLCGFWARYAAYLVDCILVATIGCIFEPIELWKRNEIGKLVSLAMGAVLIAYFWLFGFPLCLLAFYATTFPLIQIIYFARMESSKEQATLGKEAVGIMVTGLNGERLTFQRALLRTFLKQLLALPLGLGWIMAGFTKQKQALHDTLCKTLVVFQGDVDRDL